jgi:hypothetical protein
MPLLRFPIRLRGESHLNTSRTQLLNFRLGKFARFAARIRDAAPTNADLGLGFLLLSRGKSRLSGHSLQPWHWPRCSRCFC